VREREKERERESEEKEEEKESENYSSSSIMIINICGKWWKCLPFYVCLLCSCFCFSSACM
jgi:hypothetical protein